MFDALKHMKSFQTRQVALAWAVLICGLLVRPAQAQVEIEASDVPHASSCMLDNDQGPGLRNVYIRLVFNNGATAARFAVALGPGVTMTYVSESTAYASVGNTQDGITICFNNCLLGEPMIATVTYMSYTTDARCSEVRIVPHPAAQTVEVRKCNGSTVVAYAQDLQIVPPATMPCLCSNPHLFPGTPSSFDCAPVAVEGTTWGRVKALYKD